MSQSPDSLIKELLSKCETAVNSGKYEEAITGCRAVLQAAPDNLKAKQLLDEAQSKMEADLFVRDNLRKAQEYFNARDYQKCVSECQKIQLLDPNNASVLKLIQMAQEKMEAEPFVQNFISSGQSLYDSGLYNEAISQWEKVRAIDSAYPGLDGMIKDAREKMGGFRDEEPTVVGRLTSDDGTEDTVMTDGMPSFELNLDNILSESGGSQPFSFDQTDDSQEPQQATEKLEFLSDEDRIKQLLRDGDQLSSHNHYQRAIEVWSEIFMLDVNHPEALQKIEVARQAAAEQRAASQEIVKRGVAAYESGDIEQARELFEQVRSTDPDNPEAARYMEMLPAAGEGPSSLEDLIAQGEDAEKRGQYREAAMLFSQALAIDADNAELADRVKNLNLQAKRQEQGRTVIGNARAFLAEGKLESARHAVTKILEGDPSNAEALEIMKEIKVQMGSSAASAESGAAASGVAIRTAARKSLPLSKILMAAGVLVVLGLGFLLYSMFSAKPKTEPSKIIVSKKPIKKPSATTAKPNVKPVAILSPQDKEKAEKLVQEAQFYFMEKRYPEAQQKADEALKIDPLNADAASVKSEADRIQKEAIAAEQKVLDDANSYFAYSEFAGAVKLYEKYLTKHPESVKQVQPQIIKCYYNLGVISIRTWRCDTAADYFRQVLFIDDTDNLSKEALGLARKCQQLGTADVEVRKAVAFMEMRK